MENKKVDLKEDGNAEYVARATNPKRKAHHIHSIIPPWRAYQDWKTPENQTFLEELGMIPKHELVVGQLYLGHCRNSSTAMWNGEKFQFLRTKFRSEFTDYCPHPEDDDGFDIFVPVQPIQGEEDARAFDCQ
jgi:hypothetical protein